MSKLGVFLILAGIAAVLANRIYGYMYPRELGYVVLAAGSALIIGGAERLIARRGTLERFGLSLLTGAVMMGVYVWLSGTLMLWRSVLTTLIQGGDVAGLRSFMGESVLMAHTLPILAIPISWFVLIVLDRMVFQLAATAVVAAAWFLPPMIGLVEAERVSEIEAQMPYLRHAFYAAIAAFAATTAVQEAIRVKPK